MPSRATAIATASERASRRTGTGAALLLVGMLAGVVSAPARAQTAPRASIFSCTDANGRLLRSDRPIAECASRDQLQLNSDGSVRRTVRPTPTGEEQALLEQQERDRAAMMSARNEAVRRDRLLLQKYPDEAAHRKAREADLDEKRRSIAGLERRLADLAAERRPLDQEREFYPAPKPLPFKLKLALDANDASVAGTRDAIATQQADIARINSGYDTQLVRLKRLWAGAPLGYAEAGAAVAR